MQESTEQRFIDASRRDEHVVETAIEIQQIPAPTFDEQRRSDLVRRRLEALGLDGVEQDALGNVYACRPGLHRRPGVLLAAHLDTVFPQGTDLTVRREGPRVFGPGIGDNSLGVAALVHLAEACQLADLPNTADIWFVADVGEEGLGNLRGMRAAVDKLAGRYTSVVAIEGSGFGRVYHRAIGVKRLRVAAHTAGGHSWADYGAPSAVHTLVKAASALVDLPLPSQPRTTLNIGVITGGTSVNTIAEEAHFLLDLRSEQQSELDQVVARVRAALAALPAGGATLTVEEVGSREAGDIDVGQPLPRAAAAALEAVGADVVWGSGSTDANVPLGRGIPAVCIGITDGGNAHRLDEYIDTGNVGRGMEALARLVWQLVGHDSAPVC